ncbi:hypothetical protein CRE_24198 [Caenorhabditis remanei]|uniref:Uncharacterized protein n=1 Tax=Caenorhabditis remanei TaxID=31234 RepID=E3N996_CAERE|nr:hypothetical protein CRE_24198 [Caenorhabditis remanei]
MRILNLNWILNPIFETMLSIKKTFFLPKVSNRCESVFFIGEEKEFSQIFRHFILTNFDILVSYVFSLRN